jgi:tRNA A37 threonylcarbamoyltransferase TsaD
MSGAGGLLLAFETSCDETAVALLDPEGRARASRVASQEDAHRAFGGVVPEIAARAHLTNLPPLLDEALADAGAALKDVSAVAATAGPGLVGALLVGLSEGKGLALGLGVPFVPVHHIEAHALSAFVDPAGAPAAAVPGRFGALVVSAGIRTSIAFTGRASTASRGRATTQPGRRSTRSRRWPASAIPAAPPWTASRAAAAQPARSRCRSSRTAPPTSASRG